MNINMYGVELIKSKAKRYILKAFTNKKNKKPYFYELDMARENIFNLYLLNIVDEKEYSHYNNLIMYITRFKK